MQEQSDPDPLQYGELTHQYVCLSVEGLGVMWLVRAGLIWGAGSSLAVEDTARALVKEVAQPGLPMACGRLSG